MQCGMFSFVVHAAQIVNEEFYFLFRCLAAKFHLVSDHCITFLLQSRLFALNAITFGRYIAFAAPWIR